MRSHGHKHFFVANEENFQPTINATLSSAQNFPHAKARAKAAINAALQCLQKPIYHEYLQDLKRLNALVEGDFKRFLDSNGDINQGLPLWFLMEILNDLPDRLNDIFAEVSPDMVSGVDLNATDWRLIVRKLFKEMEQVNADEEGLQRKLKAVKFMVHYFGAHKKISEFNIILKNLLAKQTIMGLELLQLEMSFPVESSSNLCNNNNELMSQPHEDLMNYDHIEERLQNMAIFELDNSLANVPFCYSKDDEEK